MNNIVLPLLCRHPNQIKDEEVYILIDLSLTNPQPLKDWLGREGNCLSDEQAARFFFHGNEEMLFDYARQHTFKLQDMVDYLKGTVFSKTALTFWEESRFNYDYNSVKLAFIDENNFGCFRGENYYNIYFTTENNNRDNLKKILKDNYCCKNLHFSYYYEIEALIKLYFAVAHQNRLTSIT